MQIHNILLGCAYMTTNNKRYITTKMNFSKKKKKSLKFEFQSSFPNKNFAEFPQNFSKNLLTESE